MVAVARRARPDPEPQGTRFRRGRPRLYGEKLKELFAIIESVPGVGKITATEIVINTNEFKKINDPRKYACYAGVAPFEHSSGTSVRGKTRTCKKANLKAKSLLHMSALIAARFNEDIREYYERKVAEGKNKMNTQS